MSARRSLRSLILVGLLLLAGCARALPPLRAPIGEEARRAVALLAARWQEFSDLRTLVDLEIRRGRERHVLTGVLLVKAPDSVRFEALSPFGQPVLLVTIHDGWLTAYNAGTDEATVGPATPDTAAALLGLPLEPDDLAGVLSGRAVPPKDLRVAEVLAPDEQGPSLELIGTVHRQRVWMDFTSGRVRQLDVTGGRYEVRVTYLPETEDRPRGFDLSAGNDYLTASVRYRNPVFDGGVEADRFRLTLPKSAKIQRLR